MLKPSFGNGQASLFLCLYCGITTGQHFSSRTLLSSPSSTYQQQVSAVHLSLPTASCSDCDSSTQSSLMLMLLSRAASRGGAAQAAEVSAAHPLLSWMWLCPEENALSAEEQEVEALQSGRQPSFANISLLCYTEVFCRCRTDWLHSHIGVQV